MFFGKNNSLWLLLSFTAFIWCNDDCIHFDISGRQICVPENVPLNLTFTIDDTCIPNRTQEFTILIEKTSGTRSLICQIGYTNTSCNPFPKSCGCQQAAFGLYTLTRTVKKRDSGTWTWTIKAAKIHQTSIEFDAECNATIPVFKVISGEDLQLLFPVRSHSKQFRQCEIQKLPEMLKTPCSKAQLTGSPPNLILNVSLLNVTSQDSGQHRIVLSNNIGSSFIEFSIEVTEDTTPTTEKAKTTTNPPDMDFANSHFGIFLISVNAGIVAAVVFRIVVKQRGRLCPVSSRSAPDGGNERIQMRFNPARPQQDDSRVAEVEQNRRSDETSSSNTYESVSDDELSMEEDTFLCIENVETDSSEDFYLHPSPSSDDLEGN